MLSVQAAAAPPRVGDRLPEFTTKMATAERIHEFRLVDHLGHGPLVFAFYPLAFTRVCTVEMCEMRDHLQAFEALGAKVFGFSTDTPQANREYARQQGLTMPLLSDANYDALPRFWPLQTVGGVAHRAKRGVLVADRDGVVVWTWVSDDPAVWVGVDEVRKHIPA